MRYSLTDFQQNIDSIRESYTRSVLADIYDNDATNFDPDAAAVEANRCTTRMFQSVGDLLVAGLVAWSFDETYSDPNLPEVAIIREKLRTLDLDIVPPDPELLTATFVVTVQPNPLSRFEHTATAAIEFKGWVAVVRFLAAMVLGPEIHRGGESQKVIWDSIQARLSNPNKWILNRYFTATANCGEFQVHRASEAVHGATPPDASFIDPKKVAQRWKLLPWHRSANCFQLQCLQPGKALWKRHGVPILMRLKKNLRSALSRSSAET